jgi:hypothetical protein
MKKFALVHYGFETPAPAIMEAWTDWFASLGDKLLENIGFSGPGREITHTGTQDLPFDLQAITGISIINAESFDEASQIANDCPSINAIRVYELRSMG